MNGLIIKILQVKSLKMVLASGFVIFVLFSCAQATDDDDFLYGKFPSGFKWGVSSPVYSPGPSGTQIKQFAIVTNSIISVVVIAIVVVIFIYSSAKTGLHSN